MITAGVDIGSVNAKAAILDDDKILSWANIRTGADSPATAAAVMDQALSAAGLAFGAIEYVVSTGYGRIVVPFANSSVTEISCHAKGAHWLCPDVRTILDMGGQDCKVIRCDAVGRVADFVMNDKCAAGTGRYLERTARTVGVSIEQMGPLSLEPVNGVAVINSFCAVFAESEIIALLRRGQHVNDLLGGALDAIAKRTVGLIGRVGVEETLAITGGVAKNVGLVRRVEDKFVVKAFIADDPQIIGAVGAALFAQDRLRKRSAALV